MSDSDRERREKEQREKAEKEQREKAEKEQREQREKEQREQAQRQQGARQQASEQAAQQAQQQAQQGGLGRDINKNPAGIADIEAEPLEMGPPEGDGAYRGPLAPSPNLPKQGGPFRPKEEQQSPEQQQSQEGEPMPGRFGRQVTGSGQQQQAQQQSEKR